MNPNSQGQPGFELPAPEAGALPSVPEQDQQAARPEIEPVAAANDMPALSPTPPQATAVPVQPSEPVIPTASTPLSGAPAAADDADLIEKEWVAKAKSIVASTRNDPRTQSRELSKFRADYMQKRYNKSIKVDES